MILVILGTQDKTFPRLLDAVQKQIDNKVIQEPVIVQAGTTPYKSKEMEIYDFIPLDQFDGFLNQADLVITHAGVGSIVSALKLGKIVIAAARRSDLGEHGNDHQQEILDEFTKQHYILPLKDFDQLDLLLIQARTFKPRHYESNTQHVINFIADYIAQH